VTERLQYYMHDEPDAFRFELSGSLSGDGAESVYHAWRTALSIIGQRPLTIDMTYIADADDRGGALLVLWHQQGARIVAASDESRALAETILGEPLPMTLTKPGLFQRLSALLCGHAVAAAEISAAAEHRTHELAPSLEKNAGFTGFSETGRLERRVPS
jgi:hypothetical protein